MSKLVRELFPPLILRLLKKTKHIQKGHGGSTQNYDEVMLAKHVVWRNEKFKSIKVTRSLRIEDITPILGTSYLVGTGETLNILDFGGGGGNHKTAADLYFPNLDFNWVVVETRSMCLQAQEKNNDSKLNFISDIASLNTRNDGIDLLIVSGSIQYTEAPLETLRKLLALKPQCIQIARTPVSKTEANINYIQESLLSDNGPGVELPENFEEALVRYPITVIPRTQLVKLLEEEYEILVFIEEGLWEIEKLVATSKEWDLYADSRPVMELNKWA